MGPVHTTRSGQRFRYHVTHPKTIRDGDPAAYRLSATAIETICCDLLAEHIASQVSSIDGEAKARQLAALVASSDRRQKRELMIERVRKTTIGDAELTLHLNDGSLLERSIERIRHGNDAKLVVGERSRTNEPTPHPQLIVLLNDAQRSQALALAKPNFTLDRLATMFGRSTERYKRLLRKLKLRRPKSK